MLTFTHYTKLVISIKLITFSYYIKLIIAIMLVTTLTLAILTCFSLGAFIAMLYTI